MADAKIYTLGALKPCPRQTNSKNNEQKLALTGENEVNRVANILFAFSNLTKSNCSFHKQFRISGTLRPGYFDF